MKTKHFNSPLNPVQVMGAVTSISMSPDGSGFMVGTDQSNRYYVTMAWEVELRATCHCGPVNDICFPSGVCHSQSFSFVGGTEE